MLFRSNSCGNKHYRKRDENFKAGVIAAKDKENAVFQCFLTIFNYCIS